MDFTVILAFFVVTVALLESAKAHHRHDSNSREDNRNRRPRIQGIYSWTRDLGRRRQCHEYAYIPPGSQVVYGQSVDDILQSLNIQPASSFYDFSTPVPIGVIAPEGGPCYYTNTTLNLGQTLTNLTSINNTQIQTNNELPLDGTALPLPFAEVQNLVGAYPALAPVCDGRDIIPTYPQGAAPVPFPGPVGVIQVFTLDSAARIKVRRPARDNHRGHHRGSNQHSDERGRNNRRW